VALPAFTLEERFHIILIQKLPTWHQSSGFLIYLFIKWPKYWREDKNPFEWELRGLYESKSGFC
jgi:hypothetical protein